MATPYPQDQEKLDLTLSYHMWQSQCVESNDLDKFGKISNTLFQYFNNMCLHMVGV
jgi:hypothetical protein